MDPLPSFDQSGDMSTKSTVLPDRGVRRSGLVLRSLIDLYRSGSVASSELVSRVTNPEQIVALLHDLMDASSREVLNMLPGGPYPSEVFDPARATDMRTMSRVTMRMLYTPSTANDSHNGRTLRDYAAAGADVRVVADVPYRLFISDRGCAVIPINPRHLQVGALVVREPTIVASLVELFRTTERRSVPLRRFEAIPIVGCDGVDRKVLMALANGLRDEAAAAEMSVSLRTYRRHVAQLVVRLGASTRFQAAVRAVERGRI